LALILKTYYKYRNLIKSGKNRNSGYFSGFAFAVSSGRKNEDNSEFRRNSAGNLFPPEIPVADGPIRKPEITSKGHAVVFYDSSGTRVACGVLEEVVEMITA
jgi:hypothetical protein